MSYTLIFEKNPISEMTYINQTSSTLENERNPFKIKRWSSVKLNELLTIRLNGCTMSECKHLSLMYKKITFFPLSD